MLASALQFDPSNRPSVAGQFARPIVRDLAAGMAISRFETKTENMGNVSSGFDGFEVLRLRKVFSKTVNTFSRRFPLYPVRARF